MQLLPHTILNMQVLSCSQYHSAQACSCCYVHNNKHAAVAMQPVSLSQSMQLLPCTQHQIRSHCHAANITQLKQEAVAMHTTSNTQPLPCSQYHSAKHEAVAMHAIPNMNCCYATNIT